MPKISPEQAHKIIMRLEGGAKLITDQGGETKWGISKKAYPDEDIPNMTEARSFEIFKADYWDAVKADFLPSPLNLLVVDSAFNQGPNKAIRFLQAALGTIAVDGRIGKQTLNAVNHVPPEEICATFMSARMIGYIGTRRFDKDGRAWFNRCGRLLLALTVWGGYE